MSTAPFRTTSLVVTLLLAGLPTFSFGQSGRDKHAVYYSGGVTFATDGSLGNGACFRVTGKVDAKDFFENLKRTENARGMTFSRGEETVTQFPEKLLLSFIIRDYPCDPRFQQEGPHVYLTREMMSALQLSLYWKNGLDMRPVYESKKIASSVEVIAPYAKDLAAELPKRFEWSWELEVASAGVPLTDSLVLMFRTPDGRIAARVAARL